MFITVSFFQYWLVFFFRYFLIQSLLYFFPLLFSSLIALHPRNHHTVVHVHESFFLFAPSLHPLTSLPYQQLSFCTLSMSLSLFCLLVQFVHQIPNTSETIWYLHFSSWLIPFSIMFSRSIYTVTKGKKCSFLQLSSISLCTDLIVVLSTHLLMEIGLLPYIGDCK